MTGWDVLGVFMDGLWGMGVGVGGSAFGYAKNRYKPMDWLSGKLPPLSTTSKVVLGGLGAAGLVGVGGAALYPANLLIDAVGAFQEKEGGG
jgi:hypothetical protein